MMRGARKLLVGQAAEEGGPMTPSELQIGARADFTGSDVLTRRG